MTAATRTSGGMAIADAVPVGLAMVAEAAWISVLAGLFQEYVLHDTTLTLLELTLFAVAGALTSRLLAGRLGDRWPSVAIALVLAVAVFGVFASSEARSIVGAGGVFGLGAAIAVHPGGILAGLAVLRGFGHAQAVVDEERLGRLFNGGLVVIAIAAIAGGLVADPWRSRFLADALTSSIVFASTAILALALTRQNVIGLDSGVDWRRNPAWVGLLIVVVLLVASLAVPATFVAPRAVDLAIEIAIGLALGPLVIVGLLAGWTKRAAWVLLLALLLDAIVIVVAPLFGARSQPRPSGVTTTPVTDSTTPTMDQGVLLVGVGLLSLVMIVGVVLLVRLWMRQAAAQAVDVDETRTIDRGERSISRSWRPPPLRFRPRPHDAVSAYRALVDDLATRPLVRREVGETPAEHAGRLRAAGLAGLSLDLLAADYALARFGGVTLSNREEARAVARWRELRRRLTGPPAPSPGPRRAGDPGPARPPARPPD